MDLKERIATDLKAAMKAGDQDKVQVLRMLRARILEREIELRTQKGRDYQLNDEEATDVLSTYAKQRRQSIDSYRQGGRTDLAEKEENELAIVQSYLPQQLSEAELEALVQKTIQEVGASGPEDMGTVMKAVISKVKGTAEGKLVNEIVRRHLGGKR